MAGEVKNCRAEIDPGTRSAPRMRLTHIFAAFDEVGAAARRPHKIVEVGSCGLLESRSAVCGLQHLDGADEPQLPAPTR